MTPDFRTDITLPADARILQLVHDYGYNLAVLADFPQHQAELLAQALWEACENSIQHAYDDEPGIITVVGELTPNALILAVHDQGLPFDETLEPKLHPIDTDACRHLSQHTLGLSLIHRCVDEVHWINHGPQGKELRLTKYRSECCRLQPQTAAPHGPPHEPPVAQSPQDYTIRFVDPEDALRVAQLMYRVYGYTYPRVNIYYPDRLAHNIKCGIHVGVVAVTADGEIVGHVGLIRPELGSLAELEQLAIAPSHRGQGLFKRMDKLLQGEIQRMELVGLYAEAVTVHTISQEGSENKGLHAAGIELLHLGVHFKKLEIIQHNLGYRDTKPGPVFQGETALVFYFDYLSPPKTTRLYAPDRHRQILTDIYRNLGVPVEFLKPEPAAGNGRLSVQYRKNYGVGLIQVDRIGSDTFPKIEQACRDLCDLAESVAVFLDLPLSQGGTPDLCEAAETIGFFFSGVRPGFASDGDFLRLQYLNATLDPDRIHLISPFARKLLDYILRDKTRVEQNR
ncbi:GNAT family N-acetyltransferase [Desulfobacca acetoxidans]|uniref:Putative anti-sigma regulatory factor, serine/threonine protein kinase n=1 Tax=Desulfobacca acetoxidans (strain ATCC 700848 / DSM 11109 / ASRB2) TaxID=880072 RepID=F2NIS6_DESAR|nr:GNAT family N-acetyltransferase [Desulfobacca acetoxidans]AEB10620.1 putative anti-sigma regulatory factor, serine/threonine protein kinase [Desulfobacca acetoxidans DSM 11109]